MIYQEPDHSYLNFATKLDGSVTGASEAQLSNALGSMLRSDMVTGDEKRSDAGRKWWRGVLWSQPIMHSRFLCIGLPAYQESSRRCYGKDGKASNGEACRIHFHGDRAGEPGGDCIFGMEASSICTVPSARRHMLNCVQEETNQSACISWSRC